MPQNAEFLVQFSKLVHLLESPVFAHLRMQTIEHAKHPFLLKALYSILMILPQSKAFKVLRKRIISVAQLPTESFVPTGEVSCLIDSKACIQRFMEVHRLHK
mmetsp:Transcript_8631/g.16904  ORF Transcript_8631/g.16904 Transcript_8631/m.16904 type:complete len:102 (+) Transcript_8631:1776-2081(+)